MNGNGRNNICDCVDNPNGSNVRLIWHHMVLYSEFRTALNYSQRWRHWGHLPLLGYAAYGHKKGLCQEVGYSKYRRLEAATSALKGRPASLRRRQVSRRAPFRAIIADRGSQHPADWRDIRYSCISPTPDLPTPATCRDIRPRRPPVRTAPSARKIG